MKSFQVIRLASLILCLLFHGSLFAGNKEKESFEKRHAACPNSRSGETVNINTAPADHIARLIHGVGLRTAEAVVLFRIESGPFLNIEELLAVKGIGRKLLSRNLCRIKL